MMRTNIFVNYYFDGKAFLQLVYVQAAMDLSQTPSDLSLPYNFPEEWIHVESLGSISNLDLNTSKLHLSVSKSLKEIGFSHVVEYTISMKELADIYAIRVPPKDYQFFSIDIANIEKKIAIEVDGPSHYMLCIDSESILRSRNGHQVQYKYEPNGATVLKQCLLTSMGWKVLNVPYWEWEKLRGDPVKESQYCNHLFTSST
jgi:RAP domain